MLSTSRFNAHFTARSTLFISLALLLTACGKEAAPIKAPPPAISFITIGTQEVGTYSEFVSRTEAYKSVDLRARVEGQITKRFFVEGESVKKNKRLFEIDRDKYEANYQEALANQQSAQTEHQRTSRDYKRGLELRPNGFISQSDLDTLASNASKARAAEKGADAALKNAELDLSYTQITAPFSGEISKVRYNVGNLVGPSSDPLATLLQDNPIYANFQVDETTYTAHLQAFSDENAGERIHAKPSSNEVTVSLILPNGRTHKHLGEINYASNEIDASTGTITMRAQFPNPTGLIRPGLYSTVVLESAEKKPLPMVPQYAVQESQLGKFVLIISAEDKVKSRNITVGRSIGTLWVATSGLKEGDRLVVEGLQKVRSGTVVTPIQKYLHPKTGGLMTQAQHDAEHANSEPPASPAADAANK